MTSYEFLKSYIGDAEFGLPSPEFEDRYPWLPSSVTRNSGFRFELDTVAANLADSEHSLVVWTQDTADGRSIIGERRFVLDNLGP